MNEVFTSVNTKWNNEILGKGQQLSMSAFMHEWSFSNMEKPCKAAVFPSYDLPIPRQVLTFGEFIHAFLLYEMSLDISNPCDNLLSVSPKKERAGSHKRRKEADSTP